MGSSESGEVADGCVGSIVWVRRRNGSWWPGKILGQEELSLSHITSPRSGTPVKLLGREDASVDWYNLEKSKRVKAFRCGEFDDCIERAEASQGMPPKKREKYARREDAILHALELERQLLENKYGKLENSSNHRSKSSPDAATSSEYLENGGRNKNESRSDQMPERLGLSPVEKNADACLYDVIARDESQLSGDDESASALPRTRGLQDFGLRTAPIREELSGLPFRAKRSRCAYLLNGSGDYLNDGRLQSSLAEMPVSKLEEKDLPYSDFGEEHISGSTEDTETDCSETDSMESDSDDDLTALSDGSASIELRPKYPRIEANEGHGSMNSDDPDELTFPDDLSNPNELASTKSGVSKWQLKRKRNNRGLGNRPLDRTDAEIFRQYTNGRSSNWTSGGTKTDSSQKSSKTVAAKHKSTGLSRSSHNIIDSDVLAWNNYSAKRGFWEDSREYTEIMFSDRHHLGGRIMLVDVDLEVQASNYRRDVPMISMLSMLNGHAIIGHPVQIEAVESGSSENLLATADNIFPESLDSPSRLPPSWRTGRRTANSRVPRPHLYSSIENDRKHQARSAPQDRKLPFGSGQGQKANVSIPIFSNYSAERIFSKNSPRKISPTTSQKIRTLSSIASEPRNRQYIMQSGGITDYRVDGLMKTESVPTTVACIPVSLVFSRLQEELLGRHQ
ncbi:hypothetical protein F511_05185 [Dorcoceras hygrometricum]|uniref:PWWP domain-containing protein n=1 Tax=Dorcoceras hygrometricum TaxID=472368 RepID=A0A2Z7C8F4_9LAMI|nr:hypothetical protein F511_05185 [Dorcoceras hygrometricum]